MDFVSYFSGKGTAFAAAQIISIVAAILLLSSFQQRTHKRIVVMQAISGLLFGIQYMLLGAYEGMACNFIGMARAITYAFRGKGKFVDSLACPLFFSFMFVASGVITYKSPISLLPIAAMVISSFVLWNTKTQQLRALTMPTSVMWLVYNALHESYVATLTEVCCEISIIIGLIRFRKKTGGEV